MSWFFPDRFRQPCRSADELASELERQARQVGDRQSGAADLLRQWVEQSEPGESPQGVRRRGAVYAALPPEEDGEEDAEPLVVSFREALLRSVAFESLLDAVARAPALAAALRRDCDAAAALGAEERILVSGLAPASASPSSPLAAAVREAAGLFLLPGAARLWPLLLGAMLAEEAGAKDVLCWAAWSRRVLSVVKRSWQREALPGLLRQLDRRLAEVAERGRAEATGKATDTAQLLRGPASKRGIRASLAREALRARRAEAAELRAQAALQCSAVSRTTAALAGSVARPPKLERLLADMGEALESLNAVIKGLVQQQHELHTSLDQMGSELLSQITGVQMTQQSFEDRAGELRREREGLQRRISDIDSNLEQLRAEAAASAQQERQLREQLRSTSAHFEELISKIVAEQDSRLEEKNRALALQESTHLALDDALREAGACDAELAEPMRRRRAELQRLLSSYVGAERCVLEAAEECLQVADHGDEVWEEAESSLSRSWDSAQQLLKRSSTLMSSEPTPVVAAPSPARAESEGAYPVMSQADLFAARGPEDQQCVDCLAPGADWASVSHGTYVCMDCAGRHRGLGVHLSFVRSTGMDVWSPTQLARMQHGGNTRFREFLASQSPPVNARAFVEAARSLDALQALYSSGVAASYREQLTQLAGADPAATLPEETSTTAAAADGATRPLDAERLALEASYAACRKRLAAPIQSSRAPT